MIVETESNTTFKTRYLCVTKRTKSQFFWSKFMSNVLTGHGLHQHVLSQAKQKIYYASLLVSNFYYYFPLMELIAPKLPQISLLFVVVLIYIGLIRFDTPMNAFFFSYVFGKLAMAL